ncbi:MAG: hypothetical protein ACYC9O_01020 [Candidatus Latescibacterota bacterium]
MRKNLTIFCGLALSVLLAGNAFAQNAGAYYKMDTDLKVVGYQEASKPYVTGIGATKNVGFGIYGLALEDVAGVKVTFEWDGGKATFRPSNSGAKIVDDEMTINGATQTPAAETGVLGSSTISAGEKNEAGFYTISLARQGSGTTPASGLLYFAVFRTADTFKVGDQLAIKATVSISNAAGVERLLGTRYFVVNQVDVKSATWGEVKSQFKNF